MIILVIPVSSFSLVSQYLLTGSYSIEEFSPSIDNPESDILTFTMKEKGISYDLIEVILFKLNSSTPTISSDPRKDNIDYVKTKRNIEVYLFTWDKVSEDDKGEDNERLREFLNRSYSIGNYSIDWVKKAKIDIIDDRTIKLHNENNYSLLTLNYKETKASNVTLKIDDGRTDEFIARMENGKLNIYENKKPSCYLWITNFNTVYYLNIINISNMSSGTYLLHAEVRNDDDSLIPGTLKNNCR